MNGIAAALQKLAGIFEERKLPYAVIGGIAVRAYAIPRPTYDVDFTLSIPRELLAGLYAAVEEHGYTVPENYQRGWVDTVAEMPLVKVRFYLGDRGVDADVFLAETPFQQEIIRRRQLIETHDGSLWLASPEDVVLLKLLAYRTRDISDVMDILFTQGKLDEDYMRLWASRIQVLDRLDEALDHYQEMP